MKIRHHSQVLMTNFLGQLFIVLGQWCLIVSSTKNTSFFSFGSSDVGTIFQQKKLLDKLQQKFNLILFYFNSPYVIKPNNFFFFIEIDFFCLFSSKFLFLYFQFYSKLTTIEKIIKITFIFIEIYDFLNFCVDFPWNFDCWWNFDWFRISFISIEIPLFSL